MLTLLVLLVALILGPDIGSGLDLFCFHQKQIEYCSRRLSIKNRHCDFCNTNSINIVQTVNGFHLVQDRNPSGIGC